MKRYIRAIFPFLLVCLCLQAQEAKNDIDFRAEEARYKENIYNFSVMWRIEGGYIQQWENSRDDSFRETYFHGGKVGIAVDFRLPYNLALQTGVHYALTYGSNSQHWPLATTDGKGIQSIDHRILKHTLLIPIRVTYEQKLWRDLSMVFYGGPQFQIGVAQQDNLRTSLDESTRNWLATEGIPLEPYERYKAKELYRFTVQLGVGGGFQWDRYRLVSGYDFGLNNLVRTQFTETKRSLWDWNWHVTFSYRL